MRKSIKAGAESRPYLSYQSDSPPRSWLCCTALQPDIAQQRRVENNNSGAVQWWFCNLVEVIPFLLFMSFFRRDRWAKDLKKMFNFLIRHTGRRSTP